MTSFVGILRKSFNKILYLLLLLPIAWILSGFYAVDQNEIAIPVILGSIKEYENAGIHYNAPYPLGEIYIVDIKKSQNITIGFGSLNYDGMSSSELNGTIVRYTGNSQETVFVDKNIYKQQFITGDENIISLEMSVLFNITSAEDWFFNYDDPRALISATAQKILFEKIANSSIDEILVRDPKMEFSLREKIQGELDILQCGIKISSIIFNNVNLPVNNVEEAFRDVKSAEDDRTKRIEDARREASIILAQGITETRQMHDTSIIKATEIKNKALTEYELFNRMVESRKLEDQFDYRLYIETMEKLLKSGNTYIIDPIDSLDRINIDQKGE